MEKKVVRRRVRRGVKEEVKKVIKPGVWNLIETVIPHTNRLLLYGPSGTGKTYAAVKYGCDKKESVFEITLTPDTPAAELRGFWVPTAREGKQEFSWMDGIAVKAWRQSHFAPTRLVLNELDHAGPDCISILHVITDDISTAGLSLPNGETIHPGPYLKIIATMNGAPESSLLPSLADRFPTAIRVNEAHPKAILQLPDYLRGVAKNSVICSDESRRISIRVWNEFDNLYKKLGSTAEALELAARAVGGARAKELHNSVKLTKVGSK